MAEDKDFLREIVREAMQQILEAEMTDALGAEPGERTEESPGLPCRPLPPHAGHPGGQAGTARAPRS